MMNYLLLKKMLLSFIDKLVKIDNKIRFLFKQKILEKTKYCF